MEKTARLYLRCDPDELALWKKCAIENGLSLSSYVRSCLNRKPPLTRIAHVDPVLVRQLGAIGNNLNQIARKVNMSLMASDRYLLEQALKAIRADLQKLIVALEK